MRGSSARPDERHRTRVRRAAHPPAQHPGTGPRHWAERTKRSQDRDSYVIKRQSGTHSSQDFGSKTLSMMYTVALEVCTLPHSTFALPFTVKLSPEPVTVTPWDLFRL